MNKAKKVFWLFDVHGPERDEIALETALKAHKVFQPDETIMGGDLLDNRAFSEHPVSKVGENRRGDLLKDEIGWANALLDRLQAQTRGRTVMLEGNHDAWVERFCAKLPAGLAESVGSALSPQVALCEGRKNFVWVPYRNLDGDRRNEYELPQGIVTVHGMSTAKDAAGKHLERYRYTKSVVFGHSHRFDNKGLSLPDGRYVEALNPGCLCKLRPTYADGPTDWAHGIAVAYLGRHSYTLYRCKIERGYTVLPDGREVRADGTAAARAA